jgi:hypothetical protein
MPYQNSLCLGVSYDSVVASFTGALKAGWIAGAAASPPETRSSSGFVVESTAVFGVGASGLAEVETAATVRPGAVVVFVSAAGDVAGVPGTSPEIELQQINKSVVKTNDHPSDCRPG